MKFLSKGSPGTSNPAGIALLCCLLCSVPRPSPAQETITDQVLLFEDLLMETAADAGQELEYNSLLDGLMEYLEDPLPLNAAGYEDLEKLHLLTHSQITNLLDYVEANGNILSAGELSLIPGFTPGLVERIRPLVSLEPFTPGQRAMPYRSQPAKTRHQLFLRLSKVVQEQTGYSAIDDSSLSARPESRFPGNPCRIFTRYGFQYGSGINAGITAEKDPGEEFFRGSNRYGFDFYSAYLQAEDAWKFSRLIVGDYQAGMGQGLVLWSGFAFGKSPDVLDTRKKNQSIKKYSSAEENRFLRGAAGTLEMGDFELTGLFSRKRIDANITFRDSLEQEATEFSSFRSTGLHALPGEIADEDAITETLAGGNLGYHLPGGRIGLSFISYLFDGEKVVRHSFQDHFGFTGSGGFNAGFDYRFSWKKLIIFGEAAINDRQSLAMLNGTVMELAPGISLSALHRWYQPDYYALYGNAFAASSLVSNEHGFYIGTVVSPFAGWTFTGSADSYSFPWLRKNTSQAPATGYDCLLQAEYTRTGGFSAHLRYKRDSKPENTRLESPGIIEVAREKLDRLRMHCSYPVSNHIEFSNRLEFTLYNKEDNAQRGYLFYHDILYRPPTGKFSLTLRYCMFDTEGYDSRVYLYEHDVLYAFRIPSFHGQGIRTYVNTKYSLSGRIDLWMKIANTFYPGKDTIGTGLNQVRGRNKTDISLQLRLNVANQT